MIPVLAAAVAANHPSVIVWFPTDTKSPHDGGMARLQDAPFSSLFVDRRSDAALQVESLEL